MSGSVPASRDIRVAAENLLLAYMMGRLTSEGSQAHELAVARFGHLCELGAEAGLAASAPELAIVVEDVVEQVPPPKDYRTRQRLPWLMQARFILARRLNTAVHARRAA